MPYKDKVAQKEAVKRAVQRHRVLQGEDNVIPKTRKDVIPRDTRQPVRPIIIALADPVKRERLRAICSELSTHKVLDDVYFG